MLMLPSTVLFPLTVCFVNRQAIQLYCKDNYGYMYYGYIRCIVLYISQTGDVLVFIYYLPTVHSFIYIHI